MRFHSIAKPDELRFMMACTVHTRAHRALGCGKLIATYACSGLELQTQMRLFALVAAQAMPE